MTRHELILAAFAAGGENVSYSPVQVQKLFFLIDREIAAHVNGPHFNFQPYDYGPFDSTVYNALSVLENAKKVHIVPSGRHRIYSLSADGYREGADLLDGCPQAVRGYLQQVANWVRSLSFEQLVAAIYKKYPDMKVNSVFRE